MANSYVEYTTTEHGTGTGINGLGQKIFTAPTKFLSINDIRAKGYNGSTWTELTITSRGTNTVTLSATPTAGSYSKVRIYRATTSDQLIDFQAGARLAESDLDTAYNQGLYVAQEVSEDAGAVGSTSTTNLSLSGTTSVDNLTATGTVTLPNSSISNDNLAGSIASSKLAGGINLTTQVTGYATGTWNFTTNSNLNLVTNSNQGAYTKIGNMCHVQFYVRVASVSGSNHLFFSLPFTSAANTHAESYNAESVGQVAQWQCSFGTDHVFAKVGQNSTNCYLYSVGNDANWSVLTNSSIDANSQIAVNLTYRTA